jgi:hypothetical protein
MPRAGAYPGEVGKFGKKRQEFEKSGNFLPVYFVKILLVKIPKRRRRYETLVSKS